jgi:hypothetical protein
MAEALTTSFPIRRKAPSARFVSSLERLVLPFAGFAMFGTGLALLFLSPTSLTGNAPLIVLAAGTGILVATVALDSRIVASASQSPLPTAALGAGSVLPAPPTVVTLAEVADATSSRTSGAEWRILSAPMAPGDETWLSWLPRESRRLGAVWTGTAPRERYTPGKSGRLVAFPTSASRADSPGENRDTGNARSSRLRSRFTDEELDRMFPPIGRSSSVFLAEAPDRVGVRRAAVEPTDAPGSSEPDLLATVDAPRPASSAPVLANPRATSDSPEVGMPPARDASEDSRLQPFPTEFGGAVEPSRELVLEASNPLPPHLRSSTLHLRFSPGSRPSRAADASIQKSVCASCSKLVVNLRMSGPCPKCLRPICDACLREAFVTRGQGWCIDCAGPPEPISTETAA